MLARRVAAAIGLIMAVVTSQLPEYVQQYRQRLGGAYDELQAIIAEFDTEAAHLSLGRDQAIGRLKANPDDLAKARGVDLENTIDRAARLERQRTAFATAGPLSQYAVLLEDFDPRLASQAYQDFQPAVPVTSAGFVAGLGGLLIGWLLTHGIAWPLRRLRRGPKPVYAFETAGRSFDVTPLPRSRSEPPRHPRR